MNQIDPRAAFRRAPLARWPLTVDAATDITPRMRRVSLVGDAAYCPSPFTGQGTSLALIGAYVLAKELGRSPQEPENAFARYEQRMRPFVDMNQALLNLARKGPAPDDEFDRAKNGIDLSAYALFV